MAPPESWSKPWPMDRVEQADAPCILPQTFGIKSSYDVMVRLATGRPACFEFRLSTSIHPTT